MQVKKFEAPTIQEALEVIKRELGPEAIILQTKKLKRGFGLMSQGVGRGHGRRLGALDAEAQASFAEDRLPETDSRAGKKTRRFAEKQADIYEKYIRGQVRRARRAPPHAPLLLPSGRKPRSGQRQHRRCSAVPGHAVCRYRPLGRRPRRQAPPLEVRTQQARSAQPQPGANQVSAGARTAGKPAGAVARSGARHLGRPRCRVEDEVRHLKRAMIEEIKSVQDEGSNLSGSGAQALMAQTRPWARPRCKMLLNNS